MENERSRTMADAVFGEPTDRLIHTAFNKAFLGHKLFGYEDVLLVLRDGEWHSAAELDKAAGWRFGGHLGGLRAKGVRWESEPDPSGGSHDYRYRLIRLGPDALF